MSHDRDCPLTLMAVPGAGDARFGLFFMSAPVRPAVAALFALDLELMRVATMPGDPMAAQMRLAWWRERITDLPHRAPPAQPLLQALHTHVIPACLAPADLLVLEDAALAFLSGDLMASVTLRGDAVFKAAARILAPGGDHGAVGTAGRLWALATLLRGPTGKRLDGALRASVQHLLAEARDVSGGRAPPAADVRPLFALAGLARHDLVQILAGRKIAHWERGVLSPWRQARFFWNMMTSGI